MPNSKLNVINTVPVGGVTISPQGAVIEGDPLEHTIESCILEAASAIRMCYFNLGDLINYAIEKWPREGNYQRYADLTGLSLQRIKNVTSTCANIPYGRRRLGGGLTFGHHTEVVALPAKEQDKWLAKAEESSLSTATLRREIKVNKSPQADIEFGGLDNIHPYVTRLVVFMGKEEREVFGDMDGEGFYEMHRDLLPVIDRYSRIVHRAIASGGGDVAEKISSDLREFGLAVAPALAD